MPLPLLCVDGYLTTGFTFSNIRSVEKLILWVKKKCIRVFQGNIRYEDLRVQKSGFWNIRLSTVLCSPNK